MVRMQVRRIAAVLLCLVTASSCMRSDDSARLLSYLKSNVTDYSPLLHPRLNQSEPVDLFIDATLSHIVSVDTAKQSIRISALIRANWQDQRLVWDPADFGNVSAIKWDASQIWFPWALVYNGVGDSQLILTPQQPVNLISISKNVTTVMISWFREFEFKCNFDMTQFPFDEHACDLLIIFPDQDMSPVNPVKSTSYALEDKVVYRSSSEWTLRKVSSFAEIQVYKINPRKEAMSLRTFKLRVQMKRVSSYYLISVSAPIILFTLLQMIVSLVPVESGEKLGFGITIMLSYTVFLLLLDGILPKTQSTPLIAYYITASMTLSTISLLLTSLVMRFHFTPEGAPMPTCARAVFVRFLGHLFRVRGAARVEQIPSDVKEFGVPKTDDGNTNAGESGDGARNDAGRSDWILAARATERLMTLISFLVVAIAIGAFIGSCSAANESAE